MRWEGQGKSAAATSNQQEPIPCQGPLKCTQKGPHVAALYWACRWRYQVTAISYNHPKSGFHRTRKRAWLVPSAASTHAPRALICAMMANAGVR